MCVYVQCVEKGFTKLMQPKFITPLFCTFNFVHGVAYHRYFIYYIYKTNNLFQALYRENDDSLALFKF